MMLSLELTAVAAAACYRSAFCAGLRPNPVETIDAWSDRCVRLPPHVAEAGQWRTSRTPFLREIMESLSPSHDCHTVVFMKCVQIGGTQIGVNWLGYLMDRALGSMLVFEPTKDLAKKISEEKVTPMLEWTPTLADKVRGARARDSGNTIFKKEYLGGFVNFIGCNSAVGMRFTSAGNIMVDEVDGCPQDVNGEGHPVDLAKKRAVTFPRWKLFLLSTPLEAATSRIQPEYEAGSRGRYHVPCPFCGLLQHLQWGQLVFTFDGVHDPARAVYRCSGCARMIAEHHKTRMINHERAGWVHDDPDNPTRSFHINALYQPYGWALSWPALASEWLLANEEAARGDLRRLKTFVNTILAETWEEKGESVDHTALYRRREEYEAACPDGVLLLTAAIDVQDDRLESEIVGWGVDEESWSIDKHVFHGSPSQPTVWKDARDWLQRTRRHACGVGLRVACVVVDTGGHHAKDAYWFVRRYRGHCYAIKGSNQQGAPLIPPRSSRARGGIVRLYLVGTVAAKDAIFPRLALEQPGPGYMHFPLRPDYNEEYFAQVTAEEKRNKYDRGVLVGYHYKKIRSRNEGLDLKVYNLVAVAFLNPHWAGLAAKLERSAQTEIPVDDETEEASIEAPPVDLPSTPEAQPAPPVDPEPPRPFVRPHRAPRRPGNFVKGWR